MSAQKRREPLAGGSTAQSRDDDTAKPATARPEFQGQSNARHAAQPAPTWTEPKGWHELTILAEHWPLPGAKS